MGKIYNLDKVETQEWLEKQNVNIRDNSCYAIEWASNNKFID